MLFMNKLEFSSLIGFFFAYIYKIIVVEWFSVRFSSFRCISNYCFYGEKMYFYINKEKYCNRKNNSTFKGKQLDSVNKAKPHQLLAVAVEISSPRNHRESNLLVKVTMNSMEQKSYMCSTVCIQYCYVPLPLAL
jgi:hypothetical protein